MNRLAKAGLAVGGAVAAAGALRRVLEPRPRYAPWEKPPYGEFPNRVLVLGGGFGGYTAAHTLCNLTRNRDDIGVMVISRENFFTFWPMVPGVIGSNVDIGNIAQALRRPLIRAGASFRRAELRDMISRTVASSPTAVSSPTIIWSWLWAASRTSSASQASRSTA